MSFTFKSRLGKLKMGSTTTITELDTSSSLNFASLKITTGLILNYVGAGILHADSTGSVTSSLLATTDIANLAVTSEKLADSIFLSGVPTTTTANDGTNTTQIATTAFVQTAVSSILSSAPETLNTLKELAAALGDDADFGSNIASSIAGKVSLNGDETINGTKTFTNLPILPSLSTVGIVHNNSDGSLYTNLIQTDDIADDSINTFKLTDSSVTTPKIMMGSITNEKIAENAISLLNMQNDSINTSKIIDKNVTTEKIGDGAVIADKIATDAVITAKIMDLNVVNSKLANGAVTTDKIAAGAVTFDKIATDAVITAKIMDLNVVNSKLATGAVTTDKIAAGAVTTDKIAAGAITSDTIAAGAITTDNIENLSVTSTKIKDGSITNLKIGNNAIRTNNLNDFCVTNEKIGPSAIRTDKIATGAITSDTIDTFAVTTDKIADAAVTFDKLNTNLVLPFNTTLEEILEGGVTVPQSLVTLGLLTSNTPLSSHQGFFHITQSDTTIGSNEIPIYTLGANIKYILETAAKIYLPAITHEGMYFSITNKSGQIIVVSTRNPEQDLTPGVNMYSYFVAPDGDDEFEVDNNRTLDVISQITNSESSWQARFY